LIVEFFNSGNHKELQIVINTFFADNCSFQTSMMEYEVYGKDKILEFFQSAHNASPDMIVMLKKVKLESELGVITSSLMACGTKQFQDAIHDLYIPRKYPKPGAVDAELWRKAWNIEKRGGHVRFVGKSSWTWLLNADMSKISKFVLMKRAIDISEAPLMS
jgi:hypothetical protein